MTEKTAAKKKQPIPRPRRTKVEVEAILRTGIPPYLEAVDVLTVTGFTPQKLSWLIEIGNFPKPDEKATANKYRRWKTGDIAGWFRQCRESVEGAMPAATGKK